MLSVVLIIEALLRTIAIQRDFRQANAFEKALLPQSGADFKTDSEVELVFTENTYGYNFIRISSFKIPRKFYFQNPLKIGDYPKWPGVMGSF